MNFRIAIVPLIFLAFTNALAEPIIPPVMPPVLSPEPPVTTVPLVPVPLLPEGYKIPPLNVQVISNELCYRPADQDLRLRFFPYGWDSDTNAWVRDHGGVVSGHIFVEIRMVSEKGEMDCVSYHSLPLEETSNSTPNFSNWSRASVRFSSQTLLHAHRVIVRVSMDRNVVIRYSGLPNDPQFAVFHVANTNAPDGYTEHWGIRDTFTYAGFNNLDSTPTIAYRVYNNVSLILPPLLPLAE